MKCENCQFEMILTKTRKYQYIESGLENVFLDNIQVYRCAKCETQIPVIPKILKLHDTIGYAVVFKAGLLSGSEILFLRKNLRIKSQNWARMLRTDKSVYSRWENGSQKVSPQSDLLIRYLYVRLIEEKKGFRFEGEIAERLSETTATSEETAIIIDAEQIEDYSYLPLSESLRLSKVEGGQTSTFDFDLDESYLFLSEIDAPLPFEKMSGDSFQPKKARADHQELALAA